MKKHKHGKAVGKNKNTQEMIKLNIGSRNFYNMAFEWCNTKGLEK